MKYIKTFEIFDNSHVYNYKLIDYVKIRMDLYKNWNKIERLLLKITPKILYESLIKCYTYKFTTKNNLDYYVYFMCINKFASFSFFNHYKKITKDNIFKENNYMYDIFNNNDAIKVLNTVIKIIKDKFLEKDINEIRFRTNKKRLNIYIYIIKKNLPEYSIIVEKENDDYIINIKK